MRTTTSRGTLLDPSGNPASDPEDTVDTGSRAQSVWSRLRGSTRSDATQRSHDKLSSLGSSSKQPKSAKTVIGGSSPRSSLSGEPWARIHPIDEKGEGPSQAWHDKQSKGVKNLFNSHFGAWKHHDHVDQEVPPDFRVDEKKMAAQLRPVLEQQKKEVAAAKRMSHDEKERAVRRQNPHASRSLLYLLTVGFGDPRLKEPKVGDCHVIKLTRDHGVVVPDSHDDRTHVLAAGRLHGAEKKPQTWEAIAFYMKTLKSGTGYKHVALPFRPEEYPRDLFVPEYMGTGVHMNIDYHQQSVEGELNIFLSLPAIWLTMDVAKKAGKDHDIEKGQTSYVNSLLHWFQPW